MSTIQTLATLADSAVEWSHGQHAFMGSSAYSAYCHHSNAYSKAFRVTFPGLPVVPAANFRTWAMA